MTRPLCLHPGCISFKNNNILGEAKVSGFLCSNSSTFPHLAVKHQLTVIQLGLRDTKFLLKILCVEREFLFHIFHCKTP